MNSDHDMAMMGMSMPGMDSSQTGISEPRTDLCCQVSPAEVPKQSSQLSPGGVGTPTGATANLKTQARDFDKVSSVESTARALGPPAPALLCVFLI